MAVSSELHIDIKLSITWSSNLSFVWASVKRAIIIIPIRITWTQTFSFQCNVRHILIRTSKVVSENLHTYIIFYASYGSRYFSSIIKLWCCTLRIYNPIYSSWFSDAWTLTPITVAITPVCSVTTRTSSTAGSLVTSTIHLILHYWFWYTFSREKSTLPGAITITPGCSIPLGTILTARCFMATTIHS